MTGTGRTSGGDGQKLGLVDQGLQIQLLPGLPLQVHQQPGDIRGRLCRSIGNGTEHARIAQPQQAVDPEHGVDAQCRMQADEAGLRADAILNRCAHALTRHQAREIDDAVQAPTQIGHTDIPGFGVGHPLHRRPGEDFTRLHQRQEVALTAGLTYTAEFSLAGNLRNAGTESVTVSFGDSQFVYVLPTSQTFATYSLAFTPSSSGLFSLSFSNAGGDNYGALLDNVSVTAVPEPQSLALLLAGVVVTGAVARRRQLR